MIWNVSPWTTEDQARAQKEGWAIFHLPYAPAIQRVDGQRVFSYDPEAVAFVVRRALGGSPFHARAAAMHFATEASWAEMEDAPVVPLGNGEDIA